MKPTDHLIALRKIVSKQSSPYRPGLMAAIADLQYALIRHERFVENTESAQSPNTPSRTALGHHTAGPTVTVRQTATDAALEVLDCVD